MQPHRPAGSGPAQQLNATGHHQWQARRRVALTKQRFATPQVTDLGLLRMAGAFQLVEETGLSHDHDQIAGARDLPVSVMCNKEFTMRSATSLLVLTLALLTGPVPATAQHDNHAGHDAAAGVIPTEPGSATFAALAEVVSILSDDPDTNWSRVDLEGLRQHLVDMDALVEGASVVQNPEAGGLQMRISLAGRPGEAASRMIPAHAPVLAAETGWSSQVTVLQDHIVWTVSAPSDDDARKIKALGFFGLMATGAHHQAHHMSLARGEQAH